MNSKKEAKKPSMSALEYKDLVMRAAERATVKEIDEILTKVQADPWNGMTTTDYLIQNLDGNKTK